MIDGDSLRINGVNMRVSNIDAPERGGRAECDAEKMLATVASRYGELYIETATEILIWPEGRHDKFKMPLIRVTVDGKDWAEFLISSSAAAPWAGKRHDWCAPQKR